MLCCLSLCLSVLSYSASAASGEIVGKTTEVGTGDKSPTNPYELQGVTDGLPLDMEPLYGDGVVNDTYNPRTGVETRWWRRLEFSGSEGWVSNSAPPGIDTSWHQTGNAWTPSSLILPKSNIYCTHLPTVDVNVLWRDDLIGIAINEQGRIQIRVPKSVASTSAEVIAWFSALKSMGRSVTVLYQLKEPEVKYHNGTDVQRVSFGSSTITKTGSNGATYSLDLSNGGYSPTIHAVGMTSHNLWFSLVDDSNYYYMVPGYKYAITVRFRLSSGTITRGVVEQVVHQSADNITDDFYVSPVKDGDGYLCTYEVIPQKQLPCWKITFNLILSGYSSNVDLMIDNVTVKRVDPDSELADKIDDQTEQQKGFFERLGDRIGGFFEGLLDGIKNLFLPSSEYITEFFDDWNTWFADHFGILYYPFDFFIDICTRLLNLQIPENPSITFPGVEIMGYTLWEDTVYSFDLSALPALANLHQTYYVVVDVIIALWLINFARKKLNEVMSG